MDSKHSDAQGQVDARGGARRFVSARPLLFVSLLVLALAIMAVVNLAVVGAEEPPVTASFDYSPSAPLIGEDVTFTSTSTTTTLIVTEEWDLDDDGNFDDASGSTAQRSFNQAGDHRVSLHVVDAVGNDDVVSKMVTVASRPPTASFTASPNPALTGQTVTFDGSASSDPDGSIARYEWDLDGNGTYETDAGADATTSHSYASAGSVSVKLRVTDDAGEQDTHTVTLTIQSRPPTASFTASPNPASTGEQVSFDASASSDPDGTVVEYEWDLDGNGTYEKNTGSDPTTSRTYATGGTIDVGLRVTDSDGDRDTTSRLLTVNDRPPTASFTIDPNPVPTGQTVNFDASGSSDPEGAIAKYEWDLDGNGTFERNTGTDATTSRSYTSSGSLTIKLRVTDSAGGTDTTTRNLTITDRSPTASFTVSPNPALAGQQVDFDASGSSDPDGTIATYRWDLDGDGTFETNSGGDATISHLYSSPGTHTVTLRVTDNAGNSDDASKTVTVEAPPTASFTVSPNPASTGETVSFDGSGSSDPDGTIAKYEWDLDGNGTFEANTGTSSTTTRTYATGGSIQVRLRVTDNDGHTGTTTRTLTINDRLPTASFSIDPNPALTGQTVNFDGSGSSDPEGSIAKYEWDLDGNGTFEKNTATDATTSRSYSAPGSLTVKLRVTDDAGGQSVTSRTLTINNRGPTASFTATPNPVLADREVIFDGSGSSDPDGTIAKYEWDLDGNGTFETNTGTTATTSHSYSTWGSVTVKLRVTDNDGGTNEATKVVVVRAPPIASFTATPNPAQTGQNVSFDGSASSDPDGSIAKYEWDLDGNGTFETDTGSTATTSRSYATAGTREVGLRVTDNLGYKTFTTRMLAIENRPPTASFTISPNPAVTGQTVTFTSTSSDPDGTITKYEWDLDGNGTFDTGKTTATVSTSYADFGTRTVKLRVTDSDGATAETTKAVTIRAPPVASFTMSPTQELTGRPVTFDGSASRDPDGTITRYEWDLDGNGTYETSETVPTTSRSYSSAGEYTIKLRVTDDHGNVSQPATATLFISDRSPIALFTVQPNPAFTGEVVNFDASESADLDGEITRYEWDLDGNGTYETDTGRSPTTSRSYLTAGSVKVKLRVTDNTGKTGLRDRTLTVNDRPPVASLTASPNPAPTGQVVTFSGSSSTDLDGTIVNYEWDLDGNGSFETDTNGTPTTSRSYSVAGLVTVKLRVTDNAGNRSTATLDLTINDRPPTASFTVSPNFAAPGAPPVTVSGQLVTFTSSSVDPDGTIASYQWDLDGDGIFDPDQTTATVSTTYATFGTVNVKLRVTDDHGSVGETTVALTIQAPPVASFTMSPNPALINQTVNFNGSASRDPDLGTIIKYEWDLDGDGTFEKDTGTRATVSTKYTTAGARTIQLQVTDSQGHKGLATQTLTVNSRPVNAVLSYTPESPLTDQTVTFRSESSPTGTDNEIVNHKWDLDGNGSFETDTGKTPETSRSYKSGGAVTVRLQVTDKFGNIGTASAEITIVNRAPSASFTYFPETPTAGETVSFVSTSSDPDGGIAEHAWDLDGDGNFNDATGRSVDKTFAEPGSYNVNLRVRDNDGAASFQSQTITVVPPAPPPPPSAPTVTETKSTSPAVLNPFPVVRIAGSIARRGVRLRRLTVDAPPESTVTIRCLGRRCPSRRITKVASAVTPGKKARASGVLRFRRFERRLLRVGIKLEVLVTKPGMIGKYTRFKIRKGRPPFRVDRCLLPGESKPTHCPEI